MQTLDLSLTKELHLNSDTFIIVTRDMTLPCFKVKTTLRFKHEGGEILIFKSTDVGKGSFLYSLLVDMFLKIN